MGTAWPISSGKWPRKTAEVLVSAISWVVFLVLDFLDTVLCIFFRIADEYIEGNARECYCHSRGEKGTSVMSDERESEVSETLYGRKNLFREIGFLGFPRKLEGLQENGGGKGVVGSRWSDCGCESCVSWMSNGDQRLHVVVKEPSKATFGHGCSERPAENVIFLHGFLSSSSLWTEMVFPCLSESTNRNYRLFAVDLLGFGRSPKPRDCLYTLRDHLEMIEESVISPNELGSFHLVSHSMGSVIALALAAKYSKSVKSITLIAPPYFPSPRDDASLTALGRLAERKIWPPLSFGSAVMSWYEHLSRCVCFLICRNHRAWEWILKLLARKRDLHFLVLDLARHTHQSAWHSMHNVICGGAKSMDKYLDALNGSGAKVHIMHGTQDQLVPPECSFSIKMKVPHTQLNILPNADHITVILDREKHFTRDLERIWASASGVRIGE
ncbi:probable lysophospholipase BODYGUARD 4 [Rhododendron vialii]|uniref:probable lysophospholipase BODYGUARD 4 n=1 Tax=Rhododendron vialii TaxID=182163 RepID=UPI00265DE8AA|nr:probable lysophospholipase BODYGUARD 4 [Rhododendron vialii]